MEDSRREVIMELDSEWHRLKYGNPIPGLYPQTGAEVVKVRGSSSVVGDKTVTRYEIVVTDQGKVVGTYKVVAEEALADYSSGYKEESEE